MEDKFKILDLFAGIGGFSVGMHRAGFETIAFCEIDKYCQQVLKTRWPGVPVYDDIHHLRGVSMSELESGRKTRRFNRQEIESRLRADWIIIENTGHCWKSWVPELRSKLFERGYSSLPIRVRADWLGYPHRRSRVFVVANTDSEPLRKFHRWWIGSCREVATELTKLRYKTPRRLGNHNGFPDWSHRRKQLGNAVMPIFPELIAHGIKIISS